MKLVGSQKQEVILVVFNAGCFYLWGNIFEEQVKIKIKVDLGLGSPHLIFPHLVNH